MAYTISLSNGTSLLGTTGLPDGSVDSSTTSLALIGKNYPNYGQLQNENFVHLLENFSNADEPSAAIPGQIWWDSANKLLKINTATTTGTLAVWKPLSTILSTELITDIPADVISVVGDFWWDKTNKQLYVYSGDTTIGLTGWVLVGPNTSSGTGTSGVFADTIVDTANFTNNVIKMVVNGQLVAIIWSPDPAQYYGEATPEFFPATPPSGWGSQSIKPGFNLVLGTTYENMYYHGTATSSATAKYADLAERFEADREYAPGTVVMLGGEKEITAVTNELSSDVFGVISTDPAYTMNAEAGDNKTHPPVALTGRVPVKVIGPVLKNQRLVSSNVAGHARAAQEGEITPWNVIGRSLQNKTDSEPGIVEAVVKIAS